MKKETMRKVRQAFEVLADTAGEIRQMGVFELRRKFPPLLAQLERAAATAATALAKEERGGDR